MYVKKTRLAQSGALCQKKGHFQVQTTILKRDALENYPYTCTYMGDALVRETLTVL